jgi:hypothetical protein
MRPKGPKVAQDKAVPMELPQDASKHDPKRGQDGAKKTEDGPKKKTVPMQLTQTWPDGRKMALR